jgi:hypothetical protein
MTVARIFGFVLILIGLAALGRDTLASASAGKLDLLALGRLWFELSPGSLNGLQAGVERYLSVWFWDAVLSPMLHWFWDAVLSPMLHWPAFLYPMVPGLLLAIFCRRRKEGRQGRRFIKSR